MTGDELEARRAAAESGDLRVLLDRLIERARPVLERMPIVPRVKALLSSDGGHCEHCATPLEFDPWRPDHHRCPACGASWSGERHHRHWARAQHLWLASRAAHCAALAAITGDERLAGRARELLAAYHQLYLALPNRDNVLGPSHLFFSTYLESIWLLDYLAAAWLLREAGMLPPDEEEGVNAVADEAARVIGEFDEGMSNRQTWNAAALTAVAAWFGDDELAQSAVGGRTGLLGHLADGFGDDGMWHEGENYHLFAIRGLLIGLEWARVAGADLTGDERLVEALGRALLAPALSALPDLTFPARQDARFGVSLAHPAYLECWELGRARLEGAAPAELAPWLAALYQVPASTAQTYDAYLHDAGEPARDRTGRSDLSWLMLLAMRPEPPGAAEWEAESAPFAPSSRLLEGQGLAVLRQPDRYLSLEAGRFAGGHGHPDRLHLTLVDHGIHWLADPGTGSYLTRDLFWYRSTLAHNAPRRAGVSQDGEDARPVAFDEQGHWGWIVAEWTGIRRTVLSGPGWLVDVVEAPRGPRPLELPWHFDGEVTVETPGTWTPTSLSGELIDSAEVFAPDAGADVVLRARRGDRTLRVHLVGGTVVRARGPGRPGQGRRPFHLVRTDDQPARLVAVLDVEGGIESVTVGADRIELAPAGWSIRFAAAAATITGPDTDVSLGGAIPAPPIRKPFLADKPIVAEGQALRVHAPPPLDGTLDGFETDAPLELADESHYYRSEDGYEGPETFAATGFVNWDATHLYLAVEVTKADVIVRPPGAPPLRLDNDPEDIHSDGIQVYYRVRADGPVRSFLIRPDLDGTIAVRAIDGDDSAEQVRGGSAIGEGGYLLTVALPAPELATLGREATIGFDLLVNEMRPGRERRSGQLAWGGASGWIYLRGDRRDPSRFGVLGLVG